MNFLSIKFEILEKQKYICVTCDIWSSRAQAYMGMTVHYMNDDFELQSFVLAFRRIKGKQTYIQMATELRKVFDEYGIPIGKITNIVTDGGSAFCKAFKVYGKNNDQLVECYDSSNDIIENENELVDAAMPFIQSENGEDFLSNIIDLEAGENGNILTDDSSENDEQFDELFSIEQDNAVNEADQQILLDDIQLPAQRRCLSHLLNLIGADFQKELDGRVKTA